MMDERTSNLLKSFALDMGKNPEDIIKWDTNEILNSSMTEFDPYRLFYYFAEFYGKQGKEIKPDLSVAEIPPLPANEAIEEAGRGPSNLVVFPLESAKSMLEAWTGGSAKKKEVK